MATACKATAAKLTPSDKRRAQTNMTGLFIGIMIASIVAVDVMIPVILNSVSGLNASDNTIRILELIPLFAGLLLMVGMASPLMDKI